MKFTPIIEFLFRWQPFEDIEAEGGISVKNSELGFQKQYLKYQILWLFNSNNVFYGRFPARNRQNSRIVTQMFRSSLIFVSWF